MKRKIIICNISNKKNILNGMRSKKGVELSMNTLIIAIIVLIVLVVVVAIFTGNMTTIAKKFNLLSEEAGESSQNSLDDLGLFACKNGDEKCVDSVRYYCTDEKWEKTGNAC